MVSSPIAKIRTRMRAISWTLGPPSEPCSRDRHRALHDVETAPMIWPPTGTGTADRPMRDLEALARDIEAADPSIWAMNVIAGYAFSDVPDAGVSFSLVTVGERAAAEAALDQMVETAIGLREFGVPKEWDLDEVLARTAEASDGPIIIVEPSDNIGGGAPGDGTAVLRGLLRHGIGNAAVAIADPEAVKALQDTKPGETRRIAVGGKGSELGGEPVEINATRSASATVNSRWKTATVIWRPRRESPSTWAPPRLSPSARRSRCSSRAGRLRPSTSGSEVPGDHSGGPCGHRREGRGGAPSGL